MAKSPSKPTKQSSFSPEARLALDRYILGIWSESDLRELFREKRPGSAELASLEPLSHLDRPRAAEKLRQELLGAPKPSETERLEALLREGVDRAEKGYTILPELQHDLQAHVDAVPASDPRAAAVRALAGLAGASQVNVSIQSVGHIAEMTTDRVAKARAAALEELAKVLAGFPHLAPRR